MYIVTEHPGWWPVDGGWLRLFETGGASPWVVYVEGGRVVTSHAERPTRRSAPPVLDQFPSDFLADLQLPRSLDKSLRGLGKVGRFRTPSLWEALVTAVLRQVVRAGQSKVL